jgi:hypothetical protein
MMLLGYMGRNDASAAPRGLGEALVVDAARRVYLNADLAAWGLMLDSEGGPDNAKLWAWYQSIGFTPAKADPKLGVMYAPWKKLIPELKTS